MQHLPQARLLGSLKLEALRLSADTEQVLQGPAGGASGARPLQAGGGALARGALRARGQQLHRGRPHRRGPAEGVAAAAGDRQEAALVRCSPTWPHNAQAWA